jgi:hypothetical protein
MALQNIMSGSVSNGQVALMTDVGGNFFSERLSYDMIPGV